jgi:hypothetical protein
MVALVTPVLQRHPQQPTLLNNLQAQSAQHSQLVLAKTWLTLHLTACAQVRSKTLASLADTVSSVTGTGTAQSIAVAVV